MGDNGITRRELIKTGLLAAAAVAAPYDKADAAVYTLSNTRSLAIYNLHTNEYFNSIYWKSGKYLPDAIRTIEYIFRDHYNGRERRIDVKLLDLLHRIQRSVRNAGPIHLISGYRSPDTNARLRRGNKKVARKSLHMYGMAADIRLPNHNLKTLRQAAYQLQLGGVGYYPRSNFVHVDVGKVRYW